jgi:hypothetical protein
MPRTLEERFTEAMFGIYYKAKDEAGYVATKFLGMVYENQGLSTAKTLINMSRPSDGYTALWERNRLDLTVEALVVDNEGWWPLFEESEIKRARDRLAKYGYAPRTKLGPG